MRSLPQVSCSLNLGLIYSVDYSYSPSDGVSIKLYFVNQNGVYPTAPLPLQKAFIRIGSASFSVYPVRGDVELSAGRRVMSVEFVDEFYQLDKYYVVLPGRGCGTNVYTLGTQVDNRAESVKLSSAIDRTAQQIKKLTQFPDYEYSFNDFLALLRTKFNVQVNAFFNTTVTQAFEGSFRNVLDEWCKYYNLCFFFENSIIKIFDPTRLNIVMPVKPADAIAYNVGWDTRSTYGKTVCNWFQQDGGEYPLNQTSNTNGPLLVRSATLYPLGYEFNLPQLLTSQEALNQTAAAMNGQAYWFLYNYNLGNTSLSTQCGFTPISERTDIPSSLGCIRSAFNLSTPGRIAIFNQQIFNQNYEMYQQYGQQIAGRYYLSERKDDLAIDQKFTWFDESEGQIFNFTNVDNKAIQLTYLTPTNDGTNQIPGTAINNGYAGINYVGNRIAYRDDYDMMLTGVFNITMIQGLVDTTYDRLANTPGSNSFNTDELNPYITGANVCVVYVPGSGIPQEIVSTFADIPSQADVFKPRFSAVPIRGISSSDYSTLKSSQSEPDGVAIVNGNNGPTVVTNTSVIKTLQQGAYTIYYDKYAQCASASTPDSHFSYQFDVRQISNDNQIGISFTKQSNNSYKLNRDYGFINSIVKNPLLPTLAQARAFPTQSVSFSLNYFYDVPANFLTNGLVGMSVSVGDNGVTATYSYSNSVLKVPDGAEDYAKLAQNMKNSWLRTYRPKEVIT